jgi:hypothetical protein
MPFDFAEDGEFDALQQGIDMIKTARKLSTIAPKNLIAMEAIR